MVPKAPLEGTHDRLSVPSGMGGMPGSALLCLPGVSGGRQNGHFVRWEATIAMTTPTARAAAPPMSSQLVPPDGGGV